MTKLEKMRYGLSGILLGTSVVHIATKTTEYTMWDGLGASIVLLLTVWILGDV